MIITSHLLGTGWETWYVIVYILLVCLYGFSIGYWLFKPVMKPQRTAWWLMIVLGVMVILI